MKLCAIQTPDACLGAVHTAAGAVCFDCISQHSGVDLPYTLQALITEEALPALREALNRLSDAQMADLAVTEPVYAPPYLHPPKIWGIGLNYPDHAKDLDEQSPQDGPASFMKPATAIIGQGDIIRLPEMSQRVTAEAEIGVIIGKRCKDVAPEDVNDVILGYTTIIDMTAEDILRRNPRFLTRAKSFDTFFSFGPWITTADDVDDVEALRITTWHNGRKFRENSVGHMTFNPASLVAFHSRVMTLMPGDIISCGTPGAAPIQKGDTVACTVTGLGRLENTVQ